MTVRIARDRVGDHRMVVIELPQGPGAGDRSPLTPSEAAVAELAALGRSNAEIAAARGVSARTVANQLASAYRKTGTGSRAALAAWLARGR